MTTGQMTTNDSTEEKQSSKSLTEYPFTLLFDKQEKNQLEMIKRGMYDQYVDWVTKHEKELPIDHPQLSSYHIQQLISEIGEVLEADKRWKNIRNVKYNKEDKLDELADCFIVLMNITMFSGFSGIQLYNAISDKINVVAERIEKEK